MPQGGRFTAPEFGPLLQSLLGQRQLQEQRLQRGERARQFDIQEGIGPGKIGFREQEATQRKELFNQQLRQRTRLFDIAEGLPPAQAHLAERIRVGDLTAFKELPASVKAQNEAALELAYRFQAMEGLAGKKATRSKKEEILRMPPLEGYAAMTALPDKPVESKEKALFNELKTDPVFSAYWFGAQYDASDPAQKIAMTQAGTTRYGFIITQMDRMGIGPSDIADVMKIPPEGEPSPAGPSFLSGAGRVGQSVWDYMLGKQNLFELVSGRDSFDRDLRRAPFAPEPLDLGISPQAPQPGQPGLPGQPGMAAPTGGDITGLGLQPTQAAQDTTGAQGGLQQIIAQILARLAQQRQQQQPQGGFIR